jgi:hypothetical protein
MYSLSTSTTPGHLAVGSLDGGLRRNIPKVDTTLSTTAQALGNLTSVEMDSCLNIGPHALKLCSLPAFQTWDLHTAPNQVSLTALAL